MSLSMLSEFRTMGRVAEQTRFLLVQRANARSLTDRQREQVYATLDHVTEVREGFELSLRSGSAAIGELRDIVRYTLDTLDTLDWSFLEELGLRLQEVNRVAPLGAQLMAFAHATVALGMLPKLPASQVSHPTSSHYRDLRLPRRPGEWLERIEELEGALTQLQQMELWATHQNWLAPAVLRRTHAYFDASAWLVRAHLQAFGVH
ncbi:MAG: hypothetical protein ACPGWR_00740 [Ardenticatenaceae bacterium]